MKAETMSMAGMRYVRMSTGKYRKLQKPMIYWKKLTGRRFGANESHKVAFLG